ncbi:MAG: flippase-like domain-containing protein [Phycisphaeraceae bacterium]|nr:flippase-like domain-containing protein [Phycisphaeraceae bacterium]
MDIGQRGAGHADAEQAASVRRSWVRVAVRGVIIAAAVGVLWWVVVQAIGHEALPRLREATAGQIGAFAALSVATVAINGLIFWMTLLPVRRLRLIDVQATNALATLSAVVPFKFSLLVRVLVHRRRDGLPLLVIGAWFAAMGVIVVAAPAPVLGGAWARGGLDFTAIAIAAAGASVVTALLVLGARWFRGEQGLARLARWADALRLGVVRRAVRTEAFANLHSGFLILSDGRVVGVTMLLRLVDLAVQAARFQVVAHVLGHPLGASEAMLLALAFFMIGVMSPVMVGVREGGVAKLAAIIGMGGAEIGPVLAVAVAAGEGVVNLVLGALGLAWIGPGVFRGERAGDGRARG